MAAKYRFKTVMVTDFDRSDFTDFRDSFGTKVTDKELFSAMMGAMDRTAVAELVRERLARKAEVREKEKIAKLEAQLKEKLEKLSPAKTEETEGAEEVAEEAAA